MARLVTALHHFNVRDFYSYRAAARLEAFATTHRRDFHHEQCMVYLFSLFNALLLGIPRLGPDRRLALRMLAQPLLT